MCTIGKVNGVFQKLSTLLRYMKIQLEIKQRVLTTMFNVASCETNNGWKFPHSWKCDLFGSAWTEDLNIEEVPKKIVTCVTLYLKIRIRQLKYLGHIKRKKKGLQKLDIPREDGFQRIKKVNDFFS